MTDDLVPEPSDEEYLSALNSLDEATYSSVPGTEPRLAARPSVSALASDELNERIDEAFALIGELAEKIGGGEGKKKPRFYNWRHQQNAEVRRHLWFELRSFVDWLNAEYFIQESNKAIPGCWYRHSDAVHIITAIWAAWVPAYYSSKSFPSNEAAIWHRDTLYPLLEKLEVSLKQCRNDQSHYERASLLVSTDDGFKSFVEDDRSRPQHQEAESIIRNLAEGKTI